MNLREAAQQALEALEVWRDSLFDENALPGWRFSVVGERAIADLRDALADTQDWDEIEALRESLREHMAEIKRLNECLTWEQHRAEHVSTHGPGCAMWGPRHYECLLQAHKALKERTDRSADTGKTSDHIADASKMVASVLEDRTVEATIKDCLTVEPVAYVTGYSKGRCIIEPVGYANKKGLFRCADDADEAFKASAIPLYATPPKREPLTEAEIQDVLRNTFVDDTVQTDDMALIRAVERAHGIGGEDKNG